MTNKTPTGRKVFLCSGRFFGVVITVNLTLAFQAVSTFPGLEVRNAFVASQSFDADRAAQLALGWNVGAAVEGGTPTLTINDAGGALVLEPKPLMTDSISMVQDRAHPHLADFSGGADHPNSHVFLHTRSLYFSAIDIPGILTNVRQNRNHAGSVLPWLISRRPAARPSKPALACRQHWSTPTCLPRGTSGTSVQHGKPTGISFPARL